MATTKWTVTYRLDGGGMYEPKEEREEQRNYHEALAKYYSLVNRTRHKLGEERLRTAVIVKTKKNSLPKWDCIAGAFHVTISVSKAEDNK